MRSGGGEPARSPFREGPSATVQSSAGAPCAGFTMVRRCFPICGLFDGGALAMSLASEKGDGGEQQGEEANGYAHDFLLRWRYEARAPSEQRPCQRSAGLHLHKEPHQR